jgi:hypothetical protein
MLIHLRSVEIDTPGYLPEVAVWLVPRENVDIGLGNLTNVEGSELFPFQKEVVLEIRQFKHTVIAQRSFMLDIRDLCWREGQAFK